MTVINQSWNRENGHVTIAFHLQTSKPIPAYVYGDIEELATRIEAILLKLVAHHVGQGLPHE